MIQCFTLEVMSGPEDGRILEFKNERAVIGSAPYNNCRFVYDHIMSPKHAEIYYIEQKCVIKDLNSTSGVFVNGKKAPMECALFNRDLIQLGRIFLRIGLNMIEEQSDENKTLLFQRKQDK